jgi:hypothetical protein
MATSPPQSSNQLSNIGDTLEHLRKAYLGFEYGFRFLLCKKSGILLISEPLPNSHAKGAEAKTEESAILLLARNGHHQNLLVIRPKSIISSLLYI